MHSIVGWLNGWLQVFEEIMIVPTAEGIAQTMDDFKFSGSSKYIVVQRMNDCHSYCDENRLNK